MTGLRPADFQAHPIWRFVTDDEPGETYMVPVSAKRVTSLAGKIIGTEVALMDGGRHWAMFSNVVLDNATLSEHFVTMSLWTGRKWFHLARYHDFDADTRGPAALAKVLRRSIGKVFPIAYDLRPYVRNAPAWLEGVIERSPRQRLTRAQVIALAVPKANDRHAKP